MQNQSSFFSGTHISSNKPISFVTLMKWMGLYFLAYAALVEAASKTVDVAVWGDHYDLSRNATGWGGFAGLKALFDQQEPGTIRLCTGDILYPNDLSDRDGGRRRIDILNDFNLTAVILGNHDLDGGEENTRNRIVESHFPWLAANAVDGQGNYFTGDHQTLLLDRDGIKVGIFGLISETTPTIVVRKNNITFTSIVSTARKMVEELKSRGALGVRSFWNSCYFWRT